jgi:hypothetical protein
MHGLTQDDIAILGAQSACGHEVYRSPQQVLKVALHFEEPEEPHWTGEVNEEIDVAVDSRLAPSRRSEESKGSDAKPGQIRSVPCQLPQYFLALVHGESIVVLFSLAVKPRTALSGRIAEETRFGWQRTGSVFRRSTCESPISYMSDGHADGNWAGSP